MDPAYRNRFNRAFAPNHYTDFVSSLEKELGCKVPYRLAESPFFIPKDLSESMARDANEILDLVLSESVAKKVRAAVPPEFDVPRMSAHPDCMQIDFAVTRGADGTLRGEVVELQAFPSLYALMVVKRRMVNRMLHSMGIEEDFSIFFEGHTESSFIAAFRDAVTDGEDPNEVVLLDLQPEQQKTYPDFVATERLIGVDCECPSRLIRRGRKLFRIKEGREIQVKRIYNRIVFDELIRSNLELPFKYTDDLDVSWFSHPNWYWTVSKYSMPFIDHPAVPRAVTVESFGGDFPEDLENYVLKPLFSFAGGGVEVDVTRDHLVRIPSDQTGNWILQRKIAYHPGIQMPDGNGVKAEVRMMFLRERGASRPRLSLNLVRLSRGKMLGVDQNKNLTWVGGGIGLIL